MEEFSGRAGQRVNRKITSDDDSDGIKNWAVDVAGSLKNDFFQLVFCAVAQPKLAVDVFHHDDSAVDDDAEVDGADGEKVGGFTSPVQKNKGEEQGQRNGQRGDHRGAKTDQEENENDKDQRHAAEKIAFDRIGGDANKVAAVVVGTNLHVRREQRPVDLLGFLLHPLENVLCLLAAAHQDDAFDRVIILFLLGLESKNAQARSVA